MNVWIPHFLVQNNWWFWEDSVKVHKWFNCYRSTIGDNQHHCWPDMYSIVWLVKYLLKILPLLIRNQWNSFLKSRFTWLNWSSKCTVTLDMVMLGSSRCTLHLFNCCNIFLYFLLMFNYCGDNTFRINLVILCWKCVNIIRD